MKTSTSGFGSSPRERNATERPAAFAVSAIPGPRSGWRGAMTISSDGYFTRSRRCAAMMMASSPAWVEAAAITRRVPMIGRSLHKVGSSTGGAGTSSLRLPTLLMRGAPSCAKRSASALDCAKHRSKRSSKAAIAPGKSRQRRNERCDTRPLTSIIGIARSAHATMRLGHKSDSTNSARSGRQ